MTLRSVRGPEAAARPGSNCNGLALGADGDHGVAIVASEVEVAGGDGVLDPVIMLPSRRRGLYFRTVNLVAKLG
jgi:hypothetical protein